MKPVRLLCYMFLWTWKCTTFKRIPIILIVLTNKNVALIYSVTICQQKTKDCALSRYFQHKLQHCCFYHWCLPLFHNQSPLITMDEMYKRKVEVEENTQLSFWRKKSKDQATNLPWMSLSLFSLRLESAKEKPNERRFKLHFVCFYRRESLFEMEIYQLPLCYWLFSRTDVKFKTIFLGNTLRFETALLCSFHRID